MNLQEACAHDALFKPWFRDPATWATWFVFLGALFGLPLDEEALAVFREHTGRTTPPTEPAREAWLCCGRRGGKSFAMAMVAVFLACFRSYREHLQPGERATIMVIAADRRQARVIFRYIGALLRDVPSLRLLIQRETSESFDLSNGCTIEVGTASHRTTRGYTFAAVLADEIAFWRTDDAAEPDYAILDAVRPGLTTIPGSMLLCASSPYARRGALWDAYKRFWGQDGAPLVWKATTRQMNPCVPQDDIDRALDRDHASASAEYLAEFRSDIQAFVELEIVENCIMPGVHELAPAEGLTYRAFVDPSGGSADSMTLAIGHTQDEMAVIDCIRERKPPFAPEAVVAEFAETLKLYGVSRVTGDRYGGEWPREQFRKRGIKYALAEKTRSDLYLNLLPSLNSGVVALLDHPRLVTQLAGLERRVARGGRESIDHAPHGHDDLANAVAGVVHLLAKPAQPRGEAQWGTYTLGAGRRDPATFDGLEYLRNNPRW